MVAGEREADGSGDSLPSGVVTFVFTDIEGSTRLLKRLGTDAIPVFDRHAQILRGAWTEHGGHEVNTEGDSFFVAFDDTDQAVAACAQVQRRLAEEPWPEGGTVRVRIGIHSAVAKPRHGDYIALGVHQAARVVSVGHGGQIMLSAAAVQRIDGSQSEGRLVPLGRFRIRDFDEPEMIHRFDPVGLSAVTTDIKATPASGHNLVRPPTSFVGRGDVVDAVVSMLEPGRIVSLIGPGGVGKTRLATEVGLAVAPDWRDGVWIIDLADMTDSSLLADTTADTLRARTADGSDPWNAVLEWAGDRRCLLIFDNTETHVEVCAQRLPELLQCEEVGVLTTGREPLSVPGEHAFRVGPLAVPDGQMSDPARVRQFAGVQLFTERSRATDPGFEVDRSNAAGVATLCGRLDGLPLALEIAAARIGVLSVDEILAGLDDRFRLLRSRDRTLPERHRTLEALLDWSCRLLDDAELAAFRRLAVFGASFSVDAAVAALADESLPADSVPELVWSLVDKSLVVGDPTESGTRYRLPENVREYAMLLLDDTAGAGTAATGIGPTGEGAATAHRLASWLLERVGPWRAGDREWIGTVDSELANLRSLIGRLGATAPDVAQLMACTVGRFHDATQSFTAGVEELRRAADVLITRTPARVAMLTALADLHLRSADIEPARKLVEEAAALQADVGPPPWNEAAVDRSGGEIACRLGDFDEAIRVARAAVARGVSTLGRARMHNLEGIARYASGDLEGAATAFREELAIWADHDHESQIASAHGNLAEVAFQLGDRAGAAYHQRACLDRALEFGQPVMIAFSYIVAGRLAATIDDWRLAVRLEAAADQALTDAGHALYDTDRALVDRLMVDATAELGAHQVSVEQELGRGLDVIEAVVLARQVFDAVEHRAAEHATDDTSTADTSIEDADHDDSDHDDTNHEDRSSS